MKEKTKSYTQEDEQAINNITAQFFDLFTNTNNQIPNIRRIEDFFLPQGIIINNTEDPPAIYDLENFIQPREEILTNGTLTNFSEWEVSHQTTILGNIATRICYYEKSGELNGQYFESKGKKMMQFLKVQGKWVLSSVVWSDAI